MAGNSIVIYSSLFGKRGNLTEPKVVPQGCDLVFFTDRDDITSKTWEVRKVKVETEDPRRASRHPKILPHLYLTDYRYSVYMDANLELRGDVKELVNEYLVEKKAKLALFSHKNNKDSRDCVYDEYDALMEGYRKGRRQDDPEVMRVQIEEYEKAGYPKHAGLAVTMVILREHNDPDVVRAMECWWSEYMAHSKRDQLSFNYSMWKSNLPVTYLPGDSRDNKYLKHHAHIQKSVFRRAWERIWQIF